ncbi:MAG: ABC transporter ATP-binding protein, partial [Clostridia bacterium]|nr:ABC transporter ATP-binding protein [Clostridia bacterium]
MLKLQNITKTYDVGGDLKVEALRGIDLHFRKSEFVSILGPSGCGKTTMLNIIGGLDKNTTGDLIINGRSTAHYSDREWDNYRNHSIGFVFQSYNLIPHMDVLANVELAPTISGVSKAERRIRSVEALKKVGLGDQLHKKPNQLSGGQMQRVAIARALVNNPEILLADEPTGALDTTTSVQIMELLKEIAKDRLIIMVTHNPDLAEEYSSRIIKLKDGLVVDDSDPYTPEPMAEQQEESEKKGKKKKEKMASMSFLTALSLSTRNLLTKKARTALVSFAGSIGIIGIAAILSLSNGVQLYIDRVQEDTLSSYPLSINKYSSDTTAIFEAMTEVQTESNAEFEEGRIYPDDSLGSMMSAMTQIQTNNVEGFIEYFEEHKKELEGSLNAYKLIYDLNIPIYSVIQSGGKDTVLQTNPTSIFDYMGDEIQTMMSSMTALAGGNTGMNFYQEMLEGVDGELINPVVKEQYDLVGEESRWPEKADEVVLVVGENNRISTMALYALGFMDPANIEEVLGSLMDPDKEYDNQIQEGFYYELDDFIGHTFSYVLPTDYYEAGSGHYTVDGKKYPIWNDRRDGQLFDEKAFLEEHGKDLTIVGVIRPNPNATSTSLSSPIAYTAALTKDVIAEINKTDLAIQQKQTPEYDVFSGTTFEEMEFTKENIDTFLEMLEESEKQGLIMMINQMMQTAFTEERLPSTLEVMDDESFATIIKMYAPNYTKANVGEFVASLDPESTMGLIGMLTQQTGQPIDAASLPAVLAMMDDESFNGIVAMFDKSAPKYTKEQIPAFLEAIGADGRAKLLDQFKQNINVTEE